MDPSFFSRLAAMFGQRMWGGGNPYEAAEKQMNQIPGIYDPYVQEGRQDLPMLHGYYAGMMQDPGAYLKKMGAGFHTDPGYQFQVNQMVDAANKAAAAGGMAGSPMEQEQVEGRANQLANQQYQQYLQNAMGAGQRGAAGLGGLESQGYNAAGQMALFREMMAQMEANKAQYQNQQAAGEGAGIGDLIGKLLGGIL